MMNYRVHDENMKQKDIAILRRDDDNKRLKDQNIHLSRLMGEGIVPHALLIHNDGLRLLSNKDIENLINREDKPELTFEKFEGCYTLTHGRCESAESLKSFFNLAKALGLKKEE